MVKQIQILFWRYHLVIVRYCLALLVISSGFAFSPTAKAGNVTMQTFQFSGTLDCTTCLTSSVTGSFTIFSESGEEIGLGAWSFATPFGAASGGSDSGTGCAVCITESGALGQETIDFTDLSGGIALRFFFPDTDPFSGGSITGGTSAGYGISRLETFIFVPPDGSIVTGLFGFSSGTMTASSPITSTPEPSSLLLLSTGFLGLLAVTSLGPFVRHFAHS